MSIFACCLTDSSHVIIYSICLNFVVKKQFNMSSTGWCFLFDTIHSVKRVVHVSCKRQVLFIAFFLYNGMVDYWLFHLSICPGGESWVFVI